MQFGGGIRNIKSVETLINIGIQNVILGTGLVNFSVVFISLKKINYQGPYVFETSRGRDPVKTAKYNMQIVDFFIENSKDV